MNIKEIIHENENEKLVQDNERKRRALNIIIHGATEIEENHITERNIEENKNDRDKEFIDTFLKTIGVAANPLSITRLGSKSPEKTRPLRVKLQNESEKNTIMSRLSNLKNAEERYKKISVTDDYTIEERRTIKSWVERANAKNNEETRAVIWKARGSPKNGMRLVSFAKR